MVIKDVLFWILMSLVFHHKHDWPLVCDSYSIFKNLIKEIPLIKPGNHYIKNKHSPCISFVTVFWILLGLIEKLKNSTDFPYIPLTVSFNVNVLQNHKTLIRTRKLIWAQKCQELKTIQIPSLTLLLLLFHNPIQISSASISSSL